MKTIKKRARPAARRRRSWKQIDVLDCVAQLLYREIPGGLKARLVRVRRDGSGRLS